MPNIVERLPIRNGYVHIYNDNVKLHLSSDKIRSNVMLKTMLAYFYAPAV